MCLNATCAKIRQSSTAGIIAGDINIDLSKYNEHLCTTNYVNTLIASNFFPVTVMPTRITPITLLQLLIICVTFKVKMLNVN